jgi:hypothetical protein
MPNPTRPFHGTSKVMPFLRLTREGIAASDSSAFADLSLADVDCLSSHSPLLLHLVPDGHGGLQISMHFPFIHLYPERQGGVQSVMDSCAKIGKNNKSEMEQTDTIFSPANN